MTNSTSKAKWPRLSFCGGFFHLLISSWIRIWSNTVKPPLRSFCSWFSWGIFLLFTHRRSPRSTKHIATISKQRRCTTLTAASPRRFRCWTSKPFCKPMTCHHSLKNTLKAIFLHIWYIFKCIISLLLIGTSSWKCSCAFSSTLFSNLKGNCRLELLVGATLCSGRCRPRQVSKWWKFSSW